MAQKWYPVIDILACIECGTCVGFCSHSVYDKEKTPIPLGCIDHCHGCGNNCPVGAISYVGDDTGWIAPVLKSKEQAPRTSLGCDCGCGCSK